MVDIFYRLPVKALGRAKIACKFWYRIISDPDFTKKHLLHAIKNPGFLYAISDATHAGPKMCFSEIQHGKIDSKIDIKKRILRLKNILLLLHLNHQRFRTPSNS